MKNIQIFLLLSILNCTLLIGEASAQWWSSGGNLFWPYGTVSTKKMIATDDWYGADSLMENQGYNIPLLVYKYAQNWQPALRVQTQYGSNFTGSSHILGAFIGNELNMQSGTQNVEVIGADLYNKNLTSGSFNWTTNTNANLVISASGTYTSFAPKGKIQWGIGFRSMFSTETGAADTVLRWAGFRSMLNPYSPGNTKIENAYSFYSSNQKPALIYGKFYHFYGEGDYNSYFGGSITQKVYTNNVSNPPTAAELNAAFPNAVEGETLYIDDNNAGINFYQVVKEGTNWWIFTGTKAL